MKTFAPSYSVLAARIVDIHRLEKFNGQCDLEITLDDGHQVYEPCDGTFQFASVGDYYVCIQHLNGVHNPPPRFVDPASFEAMHCEVAA
jgi:hypothetical protein